MTRFELIGTEQVCAPLLLNNLAAGSQDIRGQDQGIQRATRFNLKKKTAVSTVIGTGDPRSVLGRLQILNQAFC
ncbi:MAG: hypothetical protein CMLOHMNK_01823 [Steroidobacteraceae bacterium]|nr:hypothetical protein [Steroidobacteraceae bacterium]